MKRQMVATALLLCVALTGCATPLSSHVTDMMVDIEPRDLSAIELSSSDEQVRGKRGEIGEFSLNIFRASLGDENILISPLSIISALAMTANGAENETLSQMEALFQTDIGGLNEYLKAYVENLPNDKGYAVRLANSIWFRDSENFTVNEFFLQTNTDYYEADIYKAPFDETTKIDINNWVKDKTDGEIPEILKEAPSDSAVMYLVNALSFEAKWQEKYEDDDIHKGTFKNVNGEKQDAEFMHSQEEIYLETELATGFVKPYEDNQYAFVAMLPNHGVTMEDFLDSFNGEALMEILDNRQQISVDTSIPKFSAEYETKLKDTLMSLGMTDPFDTGAADFSGLGFSEIGNIFISEVIHKTKIEVDAVGTKAAAATVVTMVAGSAAPETKFVNLDRPFFYMIVDTEQNLPLFMGVLNHVAPHG